MVAAPALFLCPLRRPAFPRIPYAESSRFPGTLLLVGPGAEEGRVLRFVGMAHEQCHIANSLKTEIIVDPRIEVRKSETLD
jgi:hypothetical protein